MILVAVLMGMLAGVLFYSMWAATQPSSYKYHNPDYHQPPPCTEPIE